MAFNKTLKNKKVLITCGPTWVAIDNMRVISNRSTGTLGHILAEKFAAKGAQVTLLEGPVTHQLKSKSVRTVKFCYFDELVKALTRELKKKCDVVIHAAAVSDFRPETVRQKKLNSRQSRINLSLVPTAKVIRKIKQLKKKVFLVGFKLEGRLTHKAIKTKTRDLFQKAGCDLVVANNLTGTAYTGFILDKDQSILKKTNSRRKLADNLITAVKERL